MSTMTERWFWDPAETLRLDWLWQIVGSVSVRTKIMGISSS